MRGGTAERFPCCTFIANGGSTYLFDDGRHYPVPRDALVLGVDDNLMLVINWGVLLGFDLIKRMKSCGGIEVISTTAD